MNTPVQLITGPFTGAACLLRGLDRLRQPDLRHFVWIPLLINLGLYGIGVWSGMHYFSAALDWLMPTWLEWLLWLLWPLFAIVLAGVAFFSFTVVANLIASPFYGPLAEKVQRQLGLSVAGEEGEGGIAAIVADIASGFRRLAYFALRALPLLLISFIPGLNLVAPFLWLLFGAWSLSFEYMAYPLEAQGIRFQQQRELAWSNRMETFGFGIAILLGLGLPVINILIPPAAVVGATLYLAERGRLKGGPVSDNTPSKL